MNYSSKNADRHSGYLNEGDLENLIDNAPKCRPGQSPIHGYGLIAFETISIGEVVIDFSDPKIYVEKLFTELEDWRVEGWKYTGLDESKCVISEYFTKYSLLNHSRTPNAVSNFEERKIFALVPIHPGEEVTVDMRLEPMASTQKSYYSFL